MAFFIHTDVDEDCDQFHTRGLKKEVKVSRSQQVVSADLLSFSLSLAASVMCTVCLVSIIPESLTSTYSVIEWCLYFSMGCGFYALLSTWLSTMPDEDEWGKLLALSPPNDEGNLISSKEQSSSWRLTVLLFLTLLLHNFPEGFAVALSSSSMDHSSSSSLASIVTLSIALHNIPEGITIAVPCMAARPNKPWFAFGLASLSGLAEPIGAWFALTMMRLNRSYTAIGHEMTSNSMNMSDSLAFVAGIMLAVAICELIPQAIEQQKESDDPNSFNFGIVLGSTVMLLTEFSLGS